MAVSLVVLYSQYVQYTTIDDYSCQIKDSNVRDYQSWQKTAHFSPYSRDSPAAACILVHAPTQVVTVIKPYGAVQRAACMHNLRVKGGKKENQGSQGREQKGRSVSFYATPSLSRSWPDPKGVRRYYKTRNASM